MDAVINRFWNRAKHQRGAHYAMEDLVELNRRVAGGGKIIEMLEELR